MNVRTKESATSEDIIGKASITCDHYTDYAKLGFFVPGSAETHGGSPVCHKLHYAKGSHSPEATIMFGGAQGVFRSIDPNPYLSHAKGAYDNWIVATPEMPALVSTLKENIFKENKFTLIEEEDELEKAIQDASYILTLEYDWDEDGALPINQQVFHASIKMLRDYSEYLQRNHIKIAPPEINPCKDGTIDLEWHTNEARLLINVREKDGEYYAYYYGDKYNDKMQVKGSVPLSEFSESLAVWMKYLV